MKKLIIIILAIAWLGFVDGTMDTVKFHYSASVFKTDNPTTGFATWWDSWSNEQSWRNQYVNGDPTQGRRLVGYGPFIWLCDFWHLIKCILIWSFMGLIVFTWNIQGHQKDRISPDDYFSRTRIWLNGWRVIPAILIGWGIYGAMHDITFKILLKSFWS